MGLITQAIQNKHQSAMQKALLDWQTKISAATNPNVHPEVANQLYSQMLQEAGKHESTHPGILNAVAAAFHGPKLNPKQPPASQTMGSDMNGGGNAMENPQAGASAASPLFSSFSSMPTGATGGGAAAVPGGATMPPGSMPPGSPPNPPQPQPQAAGSQGPLSQPQLPLQLPLQQPPSSAAVPMGPSQASTPPAILPSGASPTSAPPAPPDPASSLAAWRAAVDSAAASSPPSTTSSGSNSPQPPPASGRQRSGIGKFLFGSAGSPPAPPIDYKVYTPEEQLQIKENAERGEAGVALEVEKQRLAQLREMFPGMPDLALMGMLTGRGLPSGMMRPQTVSRAVDGGDLPPGTTDIYGQPVTKGQSYNIRQDYLNNTLEYLPARGPNMAGAPVGWTKDPGSSTGFSEVRVDRNGHPFTIPDALPPAPYLEKVNKTTRGQVVTVGGNVEVIPMTTQTESGPQLPSGPAAPGSSGTPPPPPPPPPAGLTGSPAPRVLGPANKTATTMMVPDGNGGFKSQVFNPGDTIPPGAVSSAGVNTLDVPTANTRQMAEKAPRVLNLVDKVSKLLDDNEQQLGPLASRWDEFTAGKVGLKNEGYTALRTDIALLTTALMNMHVGARGGEEMMKHFGNLFELGIQDPDNLRSALNEVKDYAQTVQREGGPKNVGTGGNAGSKPVVKNKADFDALPKGTMYIGKDGNTYRKP